MAMVALLPRLLVLSSVLVSLLLSGHSYAEQPTAIGLITGSKTGTYIEIGKDIAKLVREKGIELDVHESNGSLENIAAVFEREDIQLGFVQSDVLGYLQESQNRKLERVAQQIAMMFPLYNEEVHLIAKKEIGSFKDLNHRIVSVGSLGSGTNLTSELLFEVSNIWPQKKYLLKDDEALQWLNDGKIDALFYVSGYPVKLLENIDKDRFHLVPIKNENLGGYYLDSTIPSGVYSWQESEVETVAVKAVLMTAGFNDHNCDTIDQLMDLIRENVEHFKDNGHSKWKEVELDYALDNWDRYGCVSSLSHSQR